MSFYCKKAEFGEIRCVEFLRFHDSTEGVRTCVAKCGGIGCFSDSETVENYEKYAFDIFLHFSLNS